MLVIRSQKQGKSYANSKRGEKRRRLSVGVLGGAHALLKLFGKREKGTSSRLEDCGYSSGTKKRNRTYALGKKKEGEAKYTPRPRP